MMIDEKFSVRIHDTYPLEDVARAHTVMFSPTDMTENGKSTKVDAGYRKSKDDGQATAKTMTCHHYTGSSCGTSIAMGAVE